MAKVLPHPDKVTLSCYANGCDLRTGLTKDVPGLLAGLESFSTPSVKEPAIVTVFCVGLDGFRFPREQCQALWARGKVPLVMLMPAWDHPSTDTRHSLEAVVAGQANTELRRCFRDAKAAGADKYPLLFSPGWEVNNAGAFHTHRDGWPWCYDLADAGTTVTLDGQDWPKGPALFVRAYRHIVNLGLQEAGDLWSWLLMGCINVDEAPEWNEFCWYDPGVGFYDWIGIGAHHEFGTAAEQIGLAMAEIGGVRGAVNKPVFLELSARDAANPTAETKPQYIQNAMYHVGWDKTLWPRLHAHGCAVSWWHDSEWGDRSGGVDSTQASRDQWEWMLRHPNFTSHLRVV